MGDEMVHPPSVGKSGPQGLPDDRSARLSARSAAVWRSVERSALLYRLTAGSRALLGRGSVTTPPSVRGSKFNFHWLKDL